MEEIFALTVLVFATSIGALILWKLFDITRNSINKNKPSYDEDRFERLAKAFIQHRKDTDRRLQTIETIITEVQPGSTSASDSQLNTPQDTIEINREASEAAYDRRNTTDNRTPEMPQNNQKMTN